MGASKGKKLRDSSKVASSVLRVEICTHSFIFKALKPWLLRRSQLHDICQASFPRRWEVLFLLHKAGKFLRWAPLSRPLLHCKTLPERLHAPPRPGNEPPTWGERGCSAVPHTGLFGTERRTHKHPSALSSRGSPLSGSHRLHWWPRLSRRAPHARKTPKQGITQACVNSRVPKAHLCAILTLTVGLRAAEMSSLDEPGSVLGSWCPTGTSFQMAAHSLFIDFCCEQHIALVKTPKWVCSAPADRP